MQQYSRRVPVLHGTLVHMRLPYRSENKAAGARAARLHSFVHAVSRMIPVVFAALPVVSFRAKAV